MSPNTSAGRPQVYIAIMGVTGAGKSTFIRTASGIDAIEIGHSLKSCTVINPYSKSATNKAGTTNVSSYTFSHEEYDITLIDTPGFNDTIRSETEVLREIADWLDTTYRNPPSIKLTGIIYMQAATEKRMFGSTLRNLKMFRQLCGDEPLKNVVLATTCWGTAERSGDMEKAVANEEQLRTDSLFWQPMLKRGSEMLRFEDTRDSAIEIITKLVNKQPIVLQIQSELVDEDKDLIDTTAGAAVNEEIKKLEEKYKKDIADVQAELREALESRDHELEVILEESKADLERLRDENRRAQDTLQYDRRNKERKRDNEIQSLKMELEITKTKSGGGDHAVLRREMQRRAEVQRLEDRARFEEMVAQIRADADRVRTEERQALGTRIQELETQRPDPPPYTEREREQVG